VLGGGRIAIARAGFEGLCGYLEEGPFTEAHVEVVPSLDLEEGVLW
jgi:hypothetical protein